MANQPEGITLEVDRIPNGAESLWTVFSCLHGAEAISIKPDNCLIYLPTSESGIAFNNLVQDTMVSPQTTSRALEKRKVYEARITTFQGVTVKEEAFPAIEEVLLSNQ